MQFIQSVTVSQYVGIDSNIEVVLYLARACLIPTRVCHIRTTSVCCRGPDKQKQGPVI